MEDILLFYVAYQSEIAFGILLNLAMTFGFGAYKVMNLNYDQTVVLMDKYPVKPSYFKIAILWFVPFLGTVYIFRELMALQKEISAGAGVYEYLEKKLQKDYAKEIANRE